MLITSATIHTEAFSHAFGGAPIIEVSGRLFPVDIRSRPLGSFTGEDEDDVPYLDAAVEAVEDENRIPTAKGADLIHALLSGTCKRLIEQARPSPTDWRDSFDSSTGRE